MYEHTTTDDSAIVLEIMLCVFLVGSLEGGAVVVAYDTLGHVRRKAMLLREAQ